MIAKTCKALQRYKSLVWKSQVSGKDREAMSKKWSAQIFGSIALLVPQLNMWGLVGYHGAMEVVGGFFQLRSKLEIFLLVFVGLISCILGDSEYTHIYV